MKKHLFLPLFALAALVFLPACTTTNAFNNKYTVTAYAPHDPDKVRVKVSLSTQHIYVMEGSRPLMAVQGCVGIPGPKGTPKGHFNIYSKLKEKRSGSYGFTSNGGPAELDKGQNVAVGYPMAYWCEFSPAYGFHQGFVWSIPRTHGCIRMHKEAAARFYQLVRIGTPVDIAETQPEDATIGKSVQPLDQRNDPNPPTALLMSRAYFQDPPGPLLIKQ